MHKTDKTVICLTYPTSFSLRLYAELPQTVPLLPEGRLLYRYRVFGSGSVVTKDVPSGVIAAENPCLASVRLLRHE